MFSTTTPFFVSQQKHLGVTPPVALNYPTPREYEVTDLLVEELKAQGTFESDEESHRRYVRSYN